MNILSSVIDAIGNTPLIRLKRASQETGCEILGKAEFLNPGQSVKDRAALGIIRDAEAKGAAEPGGTIVEGTAGNTGIGLALVGNALGYKTRNRLPTHAEPGKEGRNPHSRRETRRGGCRPLFQPQSLCALFRSAGAEDLPGSEPNGAIWANQFDNTANRQVHAETTGPEIFEQTDGKVDGFICAVGSGGTLAGVAEALRARKPGVKIGLADPPGGASLFNYYAMAS